MLGRDRGIQDIGGRILVQVVFVIGKRAAAAAQKTLLQEAL